MKNKNPKFIGMDIGGTKILVQTFDEKLNVLSEEKVATDTKHWREGFMKELFCLIDEFFSKSVKGIALGVPGIVERKTGILVRAPHLPTGRNLKLKQILEKRYKVKIGIVNDIKAFLADEYAQPRLKKFNNILALMVGTGVGGAVIADGKMMFGSNGFAGEFGHIIIDKSGKHKTLEENVGGHYLELHPELRKDCVKNLGIGLAELSLIFDPEAVVIGGSVYLNLISSKKAELARIIKSNTLAHKAPLIFSAHNKSSVARGAVRIMKSQ